MGIPMATQPREFIVAPLLPPGSLILMAVSYTHLNSAYHRFFDNLREEQDNNLKIKEDMCVRLENYATVSFEKLSDWNVATDSVLALQTEWKHAGTIPLKERNRLYKRYRAACDTFFDRKRQYFQDIQALQNKNLTKKIELCEKVEALKDSTDWGTTTKKIIEYQKEWKTIGPVSKKISNKIWNRFRSACDYFFDRKSAQFKMCIRDSYKDAVLKAVNLGHDTDTVGAITGGLAGIIYGYDTIPSEWIDILARKDDIIKLGEKLDSIYGGVAEQSF